VSAYRRKSVADLSPVGSRFSATSCGGRTHESRSRGIKLSLTDVGPCGADTPTRKSSLVALQRMQVSTCILP
jgi:hypothetical protein